MLRLKRRVVRYVRSTEVKVVGQAMTLIRTLVMRRVCPRIYKQHK